MNDKPNITEQMYRETSEHFMQELKKKDRIIKFLKNRLDEVAYQKKHIEKIGDRIKYALKINNQMISNTNDNIYEYLGEIGNRTACIDDNTRSVDGDIDDFIENYLDNVSEIDLEEYT